jgi:predicted transcriptional regulator
MHNECMKPIQQIIRDLRQSQSQEEIAASAGASQSLISRWEAGSIPAAADVALRLVDMSRKRRNPGRPRASAQSAKA